MVNIETMIDETEKPAYIASKGKLAMKRYEEFAIFRQNLTILQATKDATNKELAEIIGLRPKRIEDFREGRLPPKFDELITIAKFFNVTLDQIMYKRIIITFEP